MKVIRNRFIPLPGFAAINILGLLFVRHGVHMDAEMLRHEAIHTRQMREMAYLPFYVWYVTEWLLRLSVRLVTLPFVKKSRRRHHLYDAYARLLFEREAYGHASDPNYLRRRKAYAWLRDISA